MSEADDHGYLTQDERTFVIALDNVDGVEWDVENKREKMWRIEYDNPESLETAAMVMPSLFLPVEHNRDEQWMTVQHSSMRDDR